MSLEIEVPRNTMLRDLDESLRQLLESELKRHRFGRVQIAFDAPARDWSATLSAPTLNLFLYDLREATTLRDAEWQQQPADGAPRLHRPPLRLECSYAVTAWAPAVEDEHRLLSQTLAILFAHERLPRECLVGDLADPVAQRFPLQTRIGSAREDGKPDLWTAIGGTYKASINYLVTLACEAGVSLQRGPAVLTQRLNVVGTDGRRAARQETLRVAGVAVDDAGAPLADAWLVLPSVGAFATTDDDGRFRFDHVASGRHRCRVRAADGREGTATVSVPAGAADLKVSFAARGRRR